MYDQHYGLTDRPFQLTPDPRFWFDTATHRKAMAYLGYGLAQGEGFIVITGDIGAGKTTLVGHLMATIDRERLHVLKLVSTQIEADDLLRLVAAGLEIDPAGLPKAALLQAIEKALHAIARSGRRTLLIVDEAQALPVSSLEELRMLSNFQLGGHALVQIFLLGQPEFRERLHGSDRLEQLRQRVIATHHLDPMGEGEVPGYVEHRLQVAGWRGNPEFTAAAYARMHHWSAGVPRRLNQLAGRVLLFGAIEGLERIDGADIDAVATDGERDAATPKATPAPATPIVADEEPAPGTAPATPVVADEVPAERTDPAEPIQPRPIRRAADDGAEAPRPLRVVPEPVTITPQPEPVCADAQLAPIADRLAELETRLAEIAKPLSGNGTLLADRLSVLEARMEEQDAALRRVLTLLVDWVESDSRRPDLAELRPDAA